MGKEYLNKPVNIFNAATASAASAAHKAKDWDTIGIEVITVGFSGTYKFQGSQREIAPDFATGAGASNPWSYLGFQELTAPGTVVAGGTGITETTATTVRNFIIPVPVLEWIGVEMTRSAGSITMNLQAAVAE